MTGIDRRTLVIGTAAAVTAASLAAEAQTAGPAVEVATSSSAFPNLFSAVTIGGVRLKNRIVHACFSTHYADESQRNFDYLVNRARGGAAAIVTDAPSMAVLTKDNGGVLRKLVAAAGRYDCKLLVQLSNNGRARHDPGRLLNGVGASALPDDISWSVPHVLSTAEVKQMIAGFGRQARLLKDCGYAGIEISASHGHLIHQWISAEANQRTDDYGGSIQNRARFITEMIAAIRATCGRPFIIGVKLAGEDGVDGGIDLAQSKTLTGIFAATGEMDYITYGWGAFADTLYWHAPDMHGPRMPYFQKIRDLATAAPGVPLGAIGLITDPNEAEPIIRDNQAQLIMLARPLTTDAAWPAKAAAGRADEIRKCVSCNACWQNTTLYSNLKCENNPIVGTADEADWKPAKAAASKRVVVVGGGPAGMEAAWTAAARGHQVMVLHASAETGGQLLQFAKLPGGGSYPFLYEYQRRTAQKNGVQVAVNTRATADSVAALKPDIVLLATGATMARPDFLPKGSAHRDLRAVIKSMLAANPPASKGTAVIYDQDGTVMTYAAAEYLREKFAHVIFVTMREGIAGDESVIGRQGINRRLYQKHMEVIAWSKPLASSAWDKSEVACANIYNGNKRIIGNVGLFTYSTYRVPNDELAAPLKAKGIEVRLLGDAYSPRPLVSAMGDGNDAAMKI